MALTVKRVERLLASGARGCYLDRDNLYLQITSSTAASWLLRYQLRKRRRELGMGSARLFGLEEARYRARKARQLIADGRDPLLVKQDEQAALAAEAARSRTFAEVKDEYSKANEKSWSAQYGHNFTASFANHAEALMPLPISGVDANVVKDVLSPIWQDKPIIAGKLRRNIGAVLDYATVSGYRHGPNPARWRGNLKILLGQQKDQSKHHPAMAYVELPAFMKRLRAIKGVPARALEFLIMTASRTGEVRGATWDEIDLENATWIVPASRMKAGKQHRVPLSKRAVELLKDLPRDSAGSWVFIGVSEGTPVGRLAMIRCLKELVGDGLSVHGCRATFRTWVAERTSTAEFVAEHCLAHVVGDASKRAYQRSDLFVKRRKLMQQWADFIDTAAVGEVTPLRRAS